MSGERRTAKVWTFTLGYIRVLASKSLETCEALEALLLAARIT